MTTTGTGTVSPVVAAAAAGMAALRRLRLAGMAGVSAERLGRLVAPRQRSAAAATPSPRRGSGGGCGLQSLALEGCSGDSQAACQAAVVAAAADVWVELSWTP
ncbi:hypothetical protein GPECTOR_42g801 [Gonium pectorale]|uniref:Uncharacterized protein n=1 Tax=Gonium pectorale TaxID=33097 RepID=A0A150GB50_GONPE|nr:hypothetical protein GPECTOR_42g801 [Gonium pectorale]|eukprot:KXZ46590.1 hypothetical protein GPECTOR_42g801 [Gonium pectorale]